jgi:hypothetical protein
VSAAYTVDRFEAFWPHYVRMHQRRPTQALHAVASLAWPALAVAAAVARRPELLLAAPACDYLVAQASHRLFERNQTTPWKNPLWHTRAELRMLRLVLTGRMSAEVARVRPYFIPSCDNTNA